MIFFPIQTWKNRVGGMDARSKSANDVVMILKSFFFAYQQLQLLESFQIQIRFQKKRSMYSMDVWMQMRQLIWAHLTLIGMSYESKKNYWL